MLRSSIRADGTRATVEPADVDGRFVRARRLTYLVLIGVYFALPWIPVAGHPAVFLDVVTRRFYLFGLSFNAQDVWLMTFLLTGGAFTLVFATALLGRVWCGWACPQTVFLDGVYRRIERAILGPREKRMRRKTAGWSWDRAWRTTVVHGLYVLVSALLAHVFLSYFTSLPALWLMMHHAPAAHPEAFGVVLFLTAVLYGNFAWFREQFCVVMCPYGRLQSVLLDQSSLVVGYDRRRGEPRGIGKQRTGKGDCVDCNRCVVVCPTGIDIRNGLQLDCIACTACIDACDEVMDKLHMPRGLVRYASQNGLEGRPTRVLRPRVFFYTALLLVGLGVSAFAFRGRSTYEANLLRLPGAPFVLEGDQVRNSFEIHLVNKQSVATRFALVAEPPDGMRIVMPLAEVTLEPLEQRRIPVFASAARGADRRGMRLKVRVTPERAATREVSAAFLGP